MTMTEFYMDVEETVYSAIEAGAKTDEDVLIYVLDMYGSEYEDLLDLDVIKNITESFVGEWM